MKPPASPPPPTKKTSSTYDTATTVPKMQPALATAAAALTAVATDPAVLVATAEIDIDLQPAGFVDVINTLGGPGDPRLSTAIWTLRTPAPAGITQAAPNSTLVVKAAMDIRFNLPKGSPFRLAGILFKRVRGSGAANGHGNLPKQHIKLDEGADGESSVRVRDTYQDRGTPNTWNWDFYLVVQDESGNIGIIDPDIENQI
jgi:hypothetical protein